MKHPHLTKKSESMKRDIIRKQKIQLLISFKICKFKYKRIGNYIEHESNRSHVRSLQSGAYGIKWQLCSIIHIYNREGDFGGFRDSLAFLNTAYCIIDWNKSTLF